MSYSSSILIYELRPLIERIQKHFSVEDDQRIISIMDECGMTIADKFIIVNNSRFDDNNPKTACATLLFSAFNDVDNFAAFDEIQDIFDAGYTEGINYVDLYEISDKLKIELLPD